MSKHTIDELQDMIVGDACRRSRTKPPMDIDRALAMKDVARVIVNSAKVESRTHADLRRRRKRIHPGTGPSIASCRCSPAPP